MSWRVSLGNTDRACKAPVLHPKQTDTVAAFHYLLADDSCLAFALSCNLNAEQDCERHLHHCKSEVFGKLQSVVRIAVVLLAPPVVWHLVAGKMQTVEDSRRQHVCFQTLVPGTPHE